MSIKETIAALNALAAEPRENSYEALDDLGTAEHLLLTCEPALSAAAMQHMMARFLRMAGIETNAAVHVQGQPGWAS